jgi:hypothetical protein
LSRAADLRARTFIAVRADRWERALAELHRNDLRVARNGKSGSASNDIHHANLAEANRRAAPTAEALRLDRDIRREQVQRALA